MSEEFCVADGRPEGWFRIDHALLTEYGAELGPYGIAVYTALAHHVNAKKECWPSFARISKLTGISRSKVISTIENLERLGLIRRQVRASQDSEFANMPSVYVLLPLTDITPKRRLVDTGGVYHVDSPVQEMDSPQSTVATGGVYHVDGGSLPRGPKQESSNKNQKQERETPAQATRDISHEVQPGTPVTARPDAPPKLRAVPKFAQTPEFAATLDALMATWPLRDGAGPNRKLAEKELVLVDPRQYSAVVAGAKRYAASRDAREGVVKNLHNWLHDEDWTRYQVVRAAPVPGPNRQLEELQRRRQAAQVQGVS